MLEFYAVRDLSPFPEDLPPDSRLVGAIDIEEYHRCAEVIHSCLSRVGVEASYFSDWTVAPEQQGEVLRCLERSRQNIVGEARRALEAFIAIVRAADGFILLAECD